MSDPYIGQVMLFAGTFAPANYAKCEGQLMPISANDALFTLIGTTYGGDGVNTFALPDLQGRVPVHMGRSPSTGTTFVEGQKAGSEAVTLTTNQIPVHSHSLSANPAAGNQASPAGGVLAGSGSIERYETVVPQTAFSNQAVAASGGSQPHENQQPFLCLTFIIALYGVYPSQS